MSVKQITSKKKEHESMENTEKMQLYETNLETQNMVDGSNIYQRTEQG